MSLELVLARHGETQWNTDGKMQGRNDSPLTAKGRAQADDLAAAAAALRVARVVASPLGRAWTTAAGCAERAGCALVECAALVEIDFGACCGLREDEIRQRYPGLLEDRRRRKWTHRWPGGESYADMVERVRPALALLAAEPRTLVVAHQAVNRVVTHLVGGVDGAAVLETAQPSDIVLRFAGGAIHHARLPLGDEPHQWLEGLPRPTRQFRT